jgi:hypothetical protein
MGFELPHFFLLLSCTLCELFLKSHWVERHCMFHHSHSTCSTWLFPPSTLWPFDFFMNFFESGKSLFYTHWSFSTFLLLRLKLPPLIRSKWRTLLSLHHYWPIRLLCDISHDRDSETATTGSGSCPQTRKSDASWGLLKVAERPF